MLLNLSPMPMPWFCYSPCKQVMANFCKFSLILVAVFSCSEAFSSESNNSDHFSSVNDQQVSLRVIYYPHHSIEKNKLINELKKHCLKNDGIEYIRKMSTLGHVLLLRSQTETALNLLFHTIKQQPETRVLEADSIIKIQ
ncbi:MAG: hypothetical protein V7785_00985 [Bermanella sp.]